MQHVKLEVVETYKNWETCEFVGLASVGPRAAWGKGSGGKLLSLWDVTISGWFDVVIDTTQG